MRRLAAPCLGLLTGLVLAACAAKDVPVPPPHIWVEPVTGMELVLLPSGTFLMGSPDGEVGRESQEGIHPVTLTRPFYLGRFEVTQSQWQRVMGSNPSHFAHCGGDCPVENVSYLVIETFFRRLEELGGSRLRLPTEAEWEYACRAGTRTPFSSGVTLSAADANFDDRFVDGEHAGESIGGAWQGGPSPVGRFPANPWGLHDLHGNVWEWTGDRHCPYPAGAVTDPRGTCPSPLQVIRGGSWYYGADSARCALRYTHHPEDRGPSLGFRVARDAAPLE